MPTVAINLRDRATAERLFTYPNDGHENETLEDTIHHYFSDSLSREGLSNFIIAPGGDAASYLVQITIDDAQVAEQVRSHYQIFFDGGLIGFQNADAFKATGHWAATWKFLLPLGVPIAFAHAVEVMDFPPLTLINNQDYLNSKTTSRWWELLIANGVSEADKARYSCICDIVPVAAKLRNGVSCAVMASNHPSFFYYAVHSNTGPGADAKNLAAGLAVLKQDIVAAAWQAKMGGDPQLDPHTTLVQCQQAWANRDDELIEIVKRQGGITAPRTLAFSPADIVDFLPSPPDLRLLERKFYLEGRKDLPEEFW